MGCGQYGDPGGVEYGGDRLQWSSRTVVEIVTRLCGRARHVAYIDWHSLIPIGDGRLIFVGFPAGGRILDICSGIGMLSAAAAIYHARNPRSEEHTSELQSLMRISYAVFCLKKKNKKRTTPITF